jgi:hypothetical protein
MLRILMLAAIVALVLPLSPGRAEEQKPKETKNVQGIQAEVRGTLHFEHGHGYFIAVKPANASEKELRVWLWISENKVLVRKLEGLDGKEVIAKGKLAQLPEGHKTSIPELGLYVSRFEIEGAAAR